MAMAYSISSHRLYVHLQNPCLVPKTVRRKTLMLQQSQLQIKKVEVPQPRLLRFNTKNKVFEDPSQGIVCYTDDNGEIICEGYDEGPRCLPQISSTVACYSREAEIIDLLQLSYLGLILEARKDQRQLVSLQQGLMMIKWSNFNII